MVIEEKLKYLDDLSSLLSDKESKDLYKELNEIKTKQVVIKGEDNWDRLLTPYQLQYYFKRKGKTIHCYHKDRKNNELSIVRIDRDTDYSDKVFSFKLYKDGTKYDFDTLEIIQLYFLFKDKNLLNREDSILIEIAKEINNPSLIKIIEIPYDVDYNIYDNECCGGEYISEKHREWR